MKQIPAFLRLILIIIAIHAAGCSVKNSEVLIQPYQEALQAYYNGIESDDPAKALDMANQALNRAPNDLATRMLRAQIYLMQYRQDLGQDQNGEGTAAGSQAKKNLLADLRIIQENLDKAPPEQDWIAPRVYTTVGDLLLLEGNKTVRIAESSLTEPNAWQVLACFDAAASYFSKAFELASKAGEEATPGMQMEAENAVGGYSQATNGCIEAFTLLQGAYGFVFLDPSLPNPLEQSAIARNFDANKRNLIHSAYETINGNTDSIKAPPANRLKLDPFFHKNAADLLSFITEFEDTAIFEMCPDGDIPAILEAQMQLQANLRLMAAHIAISRMLNNTGAVFPPKEVMEWGFQRDEKTPCPN